MTTETTTFRVNITHPEPVQTPELLNQVKSAVEGIQINAKKVYKVELTEEPETANLVIRLAENPSKAASEALIAGFEAVSGHKVILNFYQNDGLEGRLESLATPVSRAYRHGILLQDFLSSNVDKSRIQVIINNFVFLDDEGDSERGRRIEGRYLWANLNFKLLRRLFAKYNVIRSLGEENLAGTQILENIPASLIDFKVKTPKMTYLGHQIC